MSARTKNFRLACAQQAVSVIGCGLRLVQPAESGIGIGLQDAAVMGKVSLRMNARPIAREVEDRGRRIGAAERRVVAHIGPEPRLDGLRLGKQRHGRVVAVNALTRKDMGAKDRSARRDYRKRCPDPTLLNCLNTRTLGAETCIIHARR